MRKLLTMGVTNVAALIERTYRESHPYQWVREALINSKEAGATKVHFGIEWQGVESKGVYRRVILDNGRGMDPDKMLLFLNTYGGTGKPIGGVHENFGHGFKTSALPWNRNGIVVVSKSSDRGSFAMVRLEYDPKAGEYGARYETVEGIRREAVYAPYDASDSDGIDYTQVIPDDWPSGVAIVLLGSPLQPDSLLGAYDRDESDLNGIARYLNTRVWDLSELNVTVDHFNAQDRKRWPKHATDKDIPNSTTKKWLSRSVRGAKYHIEFEQKEEGTVVGRVESQGQVAVGNGLAAIKWFVRSGTPTQSSSVAQYRGYIGHLYKNEIYTPLTHPSSFRSFGIPGWLRENVYLIVVPKEFDGVSGAYPNDARTQLLLGGKDAGRALPVVEWANEFANTLPPEITKRISEHFDEMSGTIRDDRWKARLQERFGFLWKIPKLVASVAGGALIKPVQTTRESGDGRGGPGSGVKETSINSKVNVGFADSGTTPAKERHVVGGLPDFKPAGQEEFDEPWILAAWETPNPSNEHRGRVLINRDHAVIKKHVGETQRAFVGDDDQVAEEVINVYGEVAVAHVAHSEQMKALLSEREVNDRLRSDAALTMALLGMWQIDAILLPRLSGKLAKRTAA